MLTFLPSLGSEMSLNIILFCLKYWRKVLMGVCDVSVIISDKNICKNIFINYGSSYTEDNINEAPLTLSVSHLENQLEKNENFNGAAQ